MTAEGCFEWQGALKDGKYGGITVGSRIDGTLTSVRVHRVAYELFHGPIPDGLTIDHLCCNKRCWNPAHLEAVTNAENIKRGGERMEACRRGHPRTEANVYRKPTGGLQCRVCKRLQAQPQDSAA